VEVDVTGAEDGTVAGMAVEDAIVTEPFWIGGI